MVSSRRAVVLVLKEKAEIVHRNGAEVRSERRTVPVPTVIRLVHYVRVPYRAAAPLSRRAVFARDGHRCQYCSHAAENIDHVVPRSRGGEHAWENVVASCRSCNARKEDRTLAEAGRQVILLEASSRVGGRIHTIRDGDEVIELGAEFIHGKPPELWSLIEEANLEMGLHDLV